MSRTATFLHYIFFRFTPASTEFNEEQHKAESYFFAPRNDVYHKTVENIFHQDINSNNQTGAKKMLPTPPGMGEVENQTMLTFSIFLQQAGKSV